ncbi:hypothetical protein EIP86_001242 [Pleurotus ostreatoroseus]|nr:hypothetical protein EIP86_001242 [Pleurotus ostreatoroseus]
MQSYQAQIALEAITSFASRTGIPLESLRCTCGGPLERRVREIMQNWERTDISPARLEASLMTGVNMGGLAYAHTHLNTQVYIALFTLLTVLFDDQLASADAEFTARFHAGLPQLHPFLQLFAEMLRTAGEHFLPFAARAIVNNALTSMDQNVFDRESKGMPLHTAAQQYVEWKRMRNGMAETFAFFVWDRHSFSNIFAYVQAIPDVLVCINYINDILSFYKEELEGETTNYVNERAVVTHKTAHAALLDTVNDAVIAVKKARDILSQAVREQEVFENFLEGFVAFHVYSPRYKILELMEGAKLLSRTRGRRTQARENESNPNHHITLKNITKFL